VDENDWSDYFEDKDDYHDENAFSDPVSVVVV
jgi:hypothetical protein